MLAVTLVGSLMSCLSRYFCKMSSSSEVAVVCVKMLALKSPVRRMDLLVSIVALTSVPEN